MGCWFPVGFFLFLSEQFAQTPALPRPFDKPSGLYFVKISKKFQPTTRLHVPFPNLLNEWRYKLGPITIVFILLVAPNNAYCFDTISLKQYSVLNIPVPSKVDITKLPIGKTFQVNHSQFTLQFFFNNRDIFGFIFKRKPNIGVIVHLCFYRSCEETSYDLRKVVAKPHELPYDKTFFSIKFPQKLQYDFQGLEFLPHK